MPSKYFNLSKACPLCNDTKVKNTFRNESFLVTCTNCRFTFSKITPTTDELIQYYNNYPEYSKVPELTRQRYNELLDTLEPFRKNNMLLDAGCGNGFFLLEARKRDWKVFGTEISEPSIAICRQNSIPVADKLVNIPEYDGTLFDVITSFEVIEHLSFPKSEIQEYRKTLRKNGALYITTPNFNSISRWILKEKWNIILYPEHLSYFTPKTLHRLLSESGFEKISILTTGISPSRIKSSLDNSNDKTFSNIGSDEQLRIQIENNRILSVMKKLVNQILSFFKAGDSLKVLYKFTDYLSK